MSVSQIILGKYLGTLIFFLILLLMVSLMPLSLAIGTELDYGLIVSGLLGLALLVAAFSAIGLFISTLTKQPTIAAFSTFSLLFLLWIIDWAAASQATEASSNVLNWLSILRHYEPLLRGDINSNDIAYYLILIFSFLALSIHRLNMQRLS
jgi:ABC-2 type transport system permease protein